MRSVGVKELKERTTEILKEVSEGQRVAVTHYGRVLAHLVPPSRKPSSAEVEQALAEAREIMESIDRSHTKPTDTVKVVEEGRRW